MLNIFFSEGQSGLFLQNLLRDGRSADMSGIDPTLLGRGLSGISIGSNISDLDSRAVELLLGDQVDEEHVKVRQILDQ